MRIVISPIQYDNLSRISIRLQAFDSTLPDRMRQIDGSRWAPELRCWHIPYTAAAWGSLKAVFPDYEIIKSIPEGAQIGKVAMFYNGILNQPILFPNGCQSQKKPGMFLTK